MARAAESFPKWQKRVFFLCWLGYAVAYLGRYNLTVALTSIQKQFGVGYTQITLLATVFLWVYASGQLVSGVLGDKVNSRGYVFIGLISAAVLNLLLAFVNSFPVFLVLWGFNGLVQSMLWGPIIRTLGLWFEGEQRDNVIFALCTSMAVGTLLAWSVLGALLDRFGWRPVFFIPGVLIGIVSVLWLLFVRQSPKEAGFDVPLHGGGQPLISKKRTPGFLKIALATGLPIVILCCVADGALKEGVNQLGPTLVLETSGVSLKQLPVFIAFIPVMNLFGTLLARRLYKALKGDGGVSCALMFGGAALSSAALYFFSGSVVAAALSLGVCAAMMTGINSILLGIVPVRYTQYGKASAVAGLLDFISYVAAGLFVALGGYLRDLTGAWVSLFLFWVVLAAAGIVLSLLSKKQRT